MQTIVLAMPIRIRVLLTTRTKLSRHERKKGSGAPNGASSSDGRARKRQAQPRPLPAARLPALHCGFFGPGQRFLESPDANGRTLSGTSAASTSRSGHVPDGLMPRPPAGQSDDLRPQAPHPLRQSASPVDVPHDERAGAVTRSARGLSRNLFQVQFSPDNPGLSSWCAARRQPPPSAHLEMIRMPAIGK